MESDREIFQRAFAEHLRRPTFSAKPMADVSEDFAVYGGDARAEIPLGKNTTLSVTGGGAAGRGIGKAKGAKMPFAPRVGIEFRHEF